jgi:hypothetical protein
MEVYTDTTFYGCSARSVSWEGSLLKRVVTCPFYLLLPNAASERGTGGGGGTVCFVSVTLTDSISVCEESWDWLQARSEPSKVREFSFQRHAPHECKVTCHVAVLPRGGGILW